MTAAGKYLKMCQDEWTGRRHDDGTPCTAAPGNCPFEKHGDMADSLSSRRNDTIVKSKQAEREENGSQVYQRVSEKELRGILESAGRLEEASNVARGVRGAGEASPGGIGSKGRGKGESQKEASLRQERALKEFAEHNGIWVENADLKFDEKYGKGVSGSEAIAYADGKDNVVHKIISDNFYAEPIDNLNRIALHNRFFPSTALTLRGIGTLGSEWLGSKFAFIVDQPLVKIDRGASDDDVYAYMESLGFVSHGIDLWKTKDGKVSVSDLHDENVVFDDHGNICVLDAEIRFTR